MRRFLVVCFWIGMLLLLFPINTFAYYTNMPASLEIGQPDFTSFVANRGNGTGSPVQGGLFNPLGMVIVNQKLVLNDYSNNRILIWNSIPVTNTTLPDVVIGQIDFTHNSANQGNANPTANTLRNPWAIASDGTRLFVADQNNNRVLIFNTVPTSNNASADVVIGQTTMNTRTTGTTASTLNQPLGLTYDSNTGKLIFSDIANNRILIYNQVPTTNGASADVVLGQVDFTHGTLNQGGSPSASTLGTVYAITTANQKLIAADGTNNRVLIWNSIPTTNDQAADIVIGQQDFVSASANQGGSVGANTVSRPEGLTSDGKRLFISDNVNFRVLVFNTIPISNGASADIVLGQPNFTSNQGGNAFTAVNTIVGPLALFTFGDKLFVGDNANRVLIFNNTLVTPLINLNSPLTNLSGGRLRASGNVVLGSRGTYSLQSLQVSVNGLAFGNVTNLGSGTDSGNNTSYDFYADFDPTVGDQRGTAENYTLKFLASTFNADTNTLFYFLPFKFTSFNVASTKSQSFSFSVNKDQLSRIKDNLDHFEVWYKKNNTTSSWTQYISNIPDTQIDNAGTVVATKTTNLINFIGSYIFKIQAIDNWGNRQDSNYLYTSGYNPITLLTSYPSFGKSFVALPTPIPTPYVFSTATPIPTEIPTPNIVPIVVPTLVETNNNSKLMYFVALIIGALGLGILILFLLRKRKAS